MTVLQQVSQVAFAVFIQVTWSHRRGHVRAARHMHVGRRNGRYRGASKESSSGVVFLVIFSFLSLSLINNRVLLGWYS